MDTYHDFPHFNGQMASFSQVSYELHVIYLTCTVTLVKRTVHDGDAMNSEVMRGVVAADGEAGGRLRDGTNTHC